MTKYTVTAKPPTTVASGTAGTLFGIVAVVFSVLLVLGVVAIAVALVILAIAVLLVWAAIMAFVEWLFARRAQPRWHDIMDESEPTKEER